MLQLPRELEQYNSTHISTYIVVQYRFYTDPKIGQNVVSWAGCVALSRSHCQLPAVMYNP